MNIGVLWIVAAIVAMALGTLLQAFGSAASAKQSDPPNWRKRASLALGTLLTASSVYFLWSGQQIVSQEASSKPVLEFTVDKNKAVTITNVGAVDVEDLAIFATVYMLSAKVSDGHLFISGVDGFSKINDPISTRASLAKRGAHLRLDLTAQSFQGLLPFREGILQPGDAALRTVYCLRIVFRNSVTKQRQIHYLTTGVLKGYPDLYGAYTAAALGGGYKTSEKLFEVREQIRKHQANLFDDDPGELYRN